MCLVKCVCCFPQTFAEARVQLLHVEGATLTDARHVLFTCAGVRALFKFCVVLQRGVLQLRVQTDDLIIVDLRALFGFLVGLARVLVAARDLLVSRPAERVVGVAVQVNLVFGKGEHLSAECLKTLCLRRQLSVIHLQLIYINRKKLPQP